MELFFDRDQERNGTGIERNENGMIEKNEQEQHDLASGPRSRMEQNDFKKSRNLPSMPEKIGFNLA